MPPPLLLMLWLPLLTTAAGAATAGCGEPGRPLVATREGLVRGAVTRSAAGAAFFAFRGIPYAQPPVGTLRFRPPRRHRGWPGVADSLQHGSRCLQFDMLNNYARDGSEDCLFANVYTPWLPPPTAAVAAGTGLAVMVFIHGGGFGYGSGDDQLYGPHYLMDQHVVLVTFNYRLGPFGFFSTQHSSAVGNYGLLDQVLLLRWVRDNVGAFGGDPSAVTVFGESSGGASVSLLVLSPLAKGLFHHAISQSGGALAHYGATGERADSAGQLAKHLNCSAQHVPAMVDCVRKSPANSIMDAVEIMGKQVFHFFPRVDSEASSSFLPKDPRIIMELGEFNIMPWMIGFTEEEGAFGAKLFLANATLSSELSSGNVDEWGKILSLSVAYKSNIMDCGFDLKTQLRKLYNFYVGNGSVSSANSGPLARAVSDRVIVVPVSEEIRLVSAHAPVYKYVLDHKGPGRQSFESLLNITDISTKPTHGDDLLYLFRSRLGDAPSTDPASAAMIRFMTSVWASFARTGRPSSGVLPMPDWPIFTAASRRHMRLNSEPSLGSRLLARRVQFWRELPINEPWRHPVREGPCAAPPTPTEAAPCAALPAPAPDTD